MQDRTAENFRDPREHSWEKVSLSGGCHQRLPRADAVELFLQLKSFGTPVAFENRVYKLSTGSGKTSWVDVKLDFQMESVHLHIGDFDCPLLFATHEYSLKKKRLTRWRTPHEKTVYYWRDEIGMARATVQRDRLVSEILHSINEIGIHFLYDPSSKQLETIPASGLAIARQALKYEKRGFKSSFVLFGRRLRRYDVLRKWRDLSEKTVAHWRDEVGLSRATAQQDALVASILYQIMSGDVVIEPQKGKRRSGFALTNLELIRRYLKPQQLGFFGRLKEKRFKSELRNLFRRWCTCNTNTVSFWQAELGLSRARAQRDIRVANQLAFIKQVGGAWGQRKEEIHSVKPSAFEISLKILHLNLRMCLSSLGHEFRQFTRVWKTPQRATFSFWQEEVGGGRAQRDTRISQKLLNYRLDPVPQKTKISQAILSVTGLPYQFDLRRQFAYAFRWLREMVSSFLASLYSASPFRRWRWPAERTVVFWKRKTSLTRSTAARDRRLAASLLEVQQVGLLPGKSASTYLSLLDRQKLKQHSVAARGRVSVAKIRRLVPVYFSRAMKLRSGPQTLNIKFLNVLQCAHADGRFFGTVSFENSENVAAQATYSQIRKHAEDDPDRAALLCLSLIHLNIACGAYDKASRTLSIASRINTSYTALQFMRRLVERRNIRGLGHNGHLAIEAFLFASGAKILHGPLGIDGVESVARDLAEEVLCFTGDVHDVERLFIVGQPRLPVMSNHIFTKTKSVYCVSNPSQFDATQNYAAQNFGERQMVQTKKMREALVVPYSDAEEELSALTEKTAKALIEEFCALMPNGDFHIWAPALELPLDDLLFASSNEFWSSLHLMAAEKQKLDAVCCTQESYLRAYQLGLNAFGISDKTCLLGPLGGESELGFTIPKGKITEDFPHATDSVLHPLIASYGGMTVTNAEVRDKSSTTSCSYLIGRNFDRNYGTDLAALGQILKENGSVVFVPTAGKRGAAQINALFELFHADWFDTIKAGPAIKLWGRFSAQTSDFSPVFETVVARALGAGKLGDKELSLIYANRRNLEAFFNIRLPKLLLAGSLLHEGISQEKPHHIVLLPGRDYLAQVAALSGRKNGALSVDIQTVFVGPRSRYKKTLADFQFTIETHSQSVFHDFFRMPLSQSILVGCSKIGAIQKQARELDAVAARAKSNTIGKKLIVFACSPFWDADKEIIETVFEKLDEMPNAFFGIRLHPTAEKEYLESCQKLCNASERAAVLDYMNLAETIVACDVLVTRFSNVGLEASLLGVDVISCNFEQAFVPIRLDKMGVSCVANSPDELMSLFDDFENSGAQWHALQASRQDYVQRNQQLFAPDAAKYMTQAIYDIAR
ncbi:hypothetical protein Q4544_15545 [Cognatishimia sp. 1_MG-2023]|uniref:hypothetical protein n=1 Tax=Cognatishimia sp. 1_MG-2023 TaxID=3062642 RepID=UPI0026E34D48|nr:hypothetical protein [Cognatishimia sp. 1_MG-2023]MDO6728354.1 hypothetical protein [Cognatishimia sp. 1_MG-2023]